MEVVGDKIVWSSRHIVSRDWMIIGSDEEYITPGAVVVDNTTLYPLKTPVQLHVVINGLNHYAYGFDPKTRKVIYAVEEVAYAFTIDFKKYWRYPSYYHYRKNMKEYISVENLRKIVEKKLKELHEARENGPPEITTPWGEKYFVSRDFDTVALYHNNTIYKCKYDKEGNVECEPVFYLDGALSLEVKKYDADSVVLTNGKGLEVTVLVDKNNYMDSSPENITVNFRVYGRDKNNLLWHGSVKYDIGETLDVYPVTAFFEPIKSRALSHVDDPLDALQKILKGEIRDNIIRNKKSIITPNGIISVVSMKDVPEVIVKAIQYVLTGESDVNFFGEHVKVTVNGMKSTVRVISMKTFRFGKNIIVEYTPENGSDNYITSANFEVGHTHRFGDVTRISIDSLLPMKTIQKMMNNEKILPSDVFPGVPEDAIVTPKGNTYIVETKNKRLEIAMSDGYRNMKYFVPFKEGTYVLKVHKWIDEPFTTVESIEELPDGVEIRDKILPQPFEFITPKRMEFISNAHFDASFGHAGYTITADGTIMDFGEFKASITTVFENGVIIPIVIIKTEKIEKAWYINRLPNAIKYAKKTDIIPSLLAFL